MGVGHAGACECVVRDGSARDLTLVSVSECGTTVLAIAPLDIGSDATLCRGGTVRKRQTPQPFQYVCCRNDMTSANELAQRPHMQQHVSFGTLVAW